MQLPRSFATCPPNCGLLFAVNTTFDAASGADDANPGDGVCETAAGNNVCTLRATIKEANAYRSAHASFPNGIEFDIRARDPNYNGIFWSINLAAALPDLSTHDMLGPGAAKLIVRRNTTGTYRIFNVTVSTPGIVNMSGLTMTNGNVGAGGTGGDLSNGSGTLNLPTARSVVFFQKRRRRD